MRGMNSETIDLVYLHPPFNSNKVQKRLGREIADEDILFDFNVKFKVQSDVIYVPIIKGNAAENTGYVSNLQPQ